MAQMTLPTKHPVPPAFYRTSDPPPPPPWDPHRREWPDPDEAYEVLPRWLARRLAVGFLVCCVLIAVGQAAILIAMAG